MRAIAGVCVVVMLAGRAAAQAAPAASPDSAVPAITLDQAVARALEVQPSMVQARGGERNAAAGLRAAWGAFLPNLSVGASSGLASTNRFNQQVGQIVTVPKNTSYSGSLSASLDLFEGFRRTATLNAARAVSDAAAAGYVSARYQTILTVKQGYFAVLADEDLVRVAQAQVDRTRQELGVSVTKMRAGAGTRSDSLRAAVDLGNAEVALLQAQANLAGAEAELGRLVGTNGPVRGVSDTTLPAFPDTVALLDSALLTAPTVLQADANAAAAGSQLTASRSQYWPTFSVSYSNGYTGLDSLGRFALEPWNATQPYVNNWSLRFSLNWTLFNGFAREQSTISAGVNRDVAQAQAADTRRQVGAQVAQQIAALGAALQQVAISEANVAASAEDLRVQQEKYRVGAGLFLDLLTSEANLIQAEVTLVQARFSYRTALATLASLVGRDL